MSEEDVEIAPRWPDQDAPTNASRLRRKLDPDQGRYAVNIWGDRG